MKRLLLSGFLLLTGLAFKTPMPQPPAQVFSADEDLLYEVRWTFIKIGTIHIRSLGPYKAIAYIDSYDGLPFVDLHSIHYTEMDSTLHSIRGYALDKDGKSWSGLRYSTSGGGLRIGMEKLYQKDSASAPYKTERVDSLQLKSSSFVDGLAIGYLPRSLIHTNRTVSVQTVLKGNLGTTTFFCSNTRSYETIDADEKPVRTIAMEGSTNAVGVYGMTGDFTGWFSDDDAAVPIKGKLKVLLGNVKVELIQWKRGGWTPPH
jgi:hypothetical protein